MTTLDLTGLTRVSRPYSVLFAAALACLAWIPSAAAQLAPKASESYCTLIKSAEARNLCLASREQFQKRDIRSALMTMRKALAVSPQEGVIHALLARIIESGLHDSGAAEPELRLALKNGAPRYTVLPLLFGVMVDRHEEIGLLSEFPDPAPGAKGDEAADILYGRATALMSLGRLDEAAAAMDRCLAVRHDIRALLGRAEIAVRQNNLPLANKLVDAASGIDAKNESAQLAKLKLIQRSGDAARTLAASDKLIALYPDRADPRLIKIETLLKLNQNAKAKAEVDALLAKSPKSNYGAYYNALLLARANQKPQAMQIILALPPTFVKNNPQMALPIAEIAIETGHPEVGSGILGNAISAAPDLLDARLRLVELRLSQNSPLSAQTLLAPVKDSHDPRVQKLLAKVQGQIAKDRAF